MRRWLTSIGLLLVFPVAQVEGGVLSDTPGWTVDGGQVDSEFGFSVSTAGDVNADGYSDVIVGAPIYDGGTQKEGAVFVYLGSASGLTQPAAWSAWSGQADSWFGASVATAGDVDGDGYSDVIVGALGFSNPELQEGRALVFHGGAGGLVASASWTYESNQVTCDLGNSVSTAGDVDGDGYSDVLVGARVYNGPAGDTGGVFVFRGSANGLSAVPDWSLIGEQAFERLGYSVSVAGDFNGDGYSDVIVGADMYDNGVSDEGRAVVYLGSAAGLPAFPDWQAESDQDAAMFGRAVSTAGDVNGDGYADVMVSAPYYDNIEQTEGRVDVFHGGPGVPDGTSDWSAEPDQASVLFGTSIATAGDVNGDGFADVIIGGHMYDNGQMEEGIAWVYLGSPGGLSTEPDWWGEVDVAGANFGLSVSMAGDVNGDGFSDVIVGANRYPGGASPVGRVYAFHGSAEGLADAEAWTAESNNVGARFGIAVASAGDVNGDGYSDVIVGADSYDFAGGAEGAAFVFHGYPGGLHTSAGWTARAQQGGAEFGYSVGSAGDVDNDGYSDVIVGIPLFDAPETNEGAAVVYHGSSVGLSPTVSWSAEINQDLARFGEWVATAGDVNGDGYSDAIVGASMWDNGQANEGGVFLYHGGANGLGASPAWVGEGNQDQSAYGYVAGTAGDVNADGYSDVIVGAYRYDNDTVDEGRAFVYHGSPSGVIANAAWTGESDQGLIGFDPPFYGVYVSTAGDVNNDGFSDVLVGAQFYDNGHTDEGAAYLYHGTENGLQAAPSWRGEGDQAYSYYGCVASTAGDVNGDGYSDLLVGAWYYSNGENSEGRAYMFYGNQGRGLTVLPNQRAVFMGRPIQLLGHARGEDCVVLNMFSRTPAGRTQARLMREIKPLRTLLDLTNLHVTPLDDTGLSGNVSLTLTPGLTPGVAYHWRVRFQYLPHMNYTHWGSIGPNGANETDFRTTGVCTPTGIPEMFCNGDDDDCDGSIDEEFTGGSTECGLGVCYAMGGTICVGGTEIPDCTAGSPTELAEVTCHDGLDNDCDGFTDESDSNCTGTCSDNDGDGYGHPGDPTCPNGSAEDCDDTNPDIHPGANELDFSCDAIDNDCDTLTDEDVCDDGLYCTEVDFCSVDRECNYIPVDCNDGLVCTTDSCDEANDTCVHVEDVCDDGNPCTQNICDPVTGDCSHPQEPCNDNDLCTMDSCDPADGCQNDNICAGCYRCETGDGSGDKCARVGPGPCEDSFCRYDEDYPVWTCREVGGQPECVIEGYCDEPVPGCNRPVVVYGRGQKETLDCRFREEPVVLWVVVPPMAPVPGGFVPVRFVIQNVWKKDLYEMELRLDFERDGPASVAFVKGSALLMGSVPVEEREQGGLALIGLGSLDRSLANGSVWVLDLVLVRKTLDGGASFHASVRAPCNKEASQIGCHSSDGTGTQPISEEVGALLQEGIYTGGEPGERIGSPAAGCSCGLNRLGWSGCLWFIFWVFLVLRKIGR